MNRTLIFLCLAAAPAAALAAPIEGRDSARLDLIGEAPSACLISAPSAEAGSNAVFQPITGDSARIRVVDLVDPATSEARATSINLAFPVICNGAHRVTVRTAQGAMVRAGPAVSAPGFRDRLPYQVSAAWGGQSVTGVSESGTPVDIQLNNGAAGLLSLAVAIAPGGDPLIAGAYSDSLIVELQPAN
jgi:hypothetical protein